MKNIHKPRERMGDKKEFTFAEMVIVIGIITILILIIGPNLQQFLDSSKQTKVDTEAETLYRAVKIYIADTCTEDERNSLANVIWKQNDNEKGNIKNVPLKKIMDKYLKRRETDSNILYEIHFDEKGKIKYVKWTEDGYTGKYPHTSK